MKKSWVLALMCVFATVPAVAPSANAAQTTVVAQKGKMLHSSDGGRLAPVYSVTDNGSAKIIIYGKVVTVPASTLSMVNGKLKTSLTKNQVISLP